jgi:hypothetical protein
MSSERAAALPPRLEGVRRRFERWRQGRQSRARIPEPLWDSAVEMAAAHGVHRTARALGVNYYTLKDRLEQRGAGGEIAPASDAAVGSSASAPPAAVTTFLEMTSPRPVGTCECTLELEDGGAKLRLHLRGVAAPDLASLSRSVWDLRS